MSAPEDPNDDDLFRAAIGDVRQIKHEDRVVHIRKLKPRARMAERDEEEAVHDFRLGIGEAALNADETLSYRGDRVSAEAWRRLKKGEYSALAELDLHDLTVAGASRELNLFLKEAIHEDISCVLIIHGKGRGSESIPQIKNLVNQRLRHDKYVLAFHSAPKHRGGEGAVYVLLRRRARA